MMNSSVFVLPFAALLLAAPAFAGGGHPGKMDTNGDGMVSATEHAAGSSAKFQAMDANKDGNVTATEMDAFHKQSGKAPMASGDWVKKQDTNGDGMISSSEHDANAKSRFAKLDTNADGNLNEAELSAARTAMAEDL
jgi:Ca2+-binding EF-hand superfamily protein